MSILWIIIAITLLLLVVWLLIQPKQGSRASNEHRSTPSAGLPSGEEQAFGTVANPKIEQKATESAPPPSSEVEIQQKATESALTPSLEVEIRHLLSADQKIDAIKRVRDITQWGLKEAKEYVDALEKHESSSISAPQIASGSTPELRQAVKRLLADHQKVSAVKLVRETNNWHLRDAKDYVDAIQEEEFQLMDMEVSNILSDPTLKEEVQHLVMKQERFAAVERVRKATGWELSQAMDYVNRVERDQASQ